MSKAGKIVVHMSVRPWLRFAVIPFVLLGISVPDFIFRAGCKITGPHHE